MKVGFPNFSVDLSKVYSFKQKFMYTYKIMSPLHT